MNKLLVLLLCCCALSGCASLKSSTGVVLNGASYHLDTAAAQARNEDNYGAALMFGEHAEVGWFRNSRTMASSHSIYYLTSRDYQGFQLGTGVALYDNKAHYEWEVKPITFIGKRINLTERVFLNLRYMPKLLTANIGIRFGPLK